MIADTSFLVALTSAKERFHQQCIEAARQVKGRIIIPVTILPEIAYLLASRRSHQVMRSFVASLSQPGWEIINLETADFSRISQLLDTFKDARLDFVDATVVAIAERLDIEVVLTLDQRDFRMIKPEHADYFKILP